MGFFDFLSGRNFRHDSGQVARLNARHRYLIAPFRSEIEGARVLDLAAHDGRWSYAFAGAGARSVIGIEGRQSLIDSFDAYPPEPFRARVELRCDDIYDGAQALVDAGEHFDIVAIFGIFYHVMDHYRLLKLVHALEPSLILVDSEFLTADRPIISVIMEDTEKPLNALPHIDGQRMAPKGVPSFAAMELMAESLGWRVAWADWDRVPEEDRRGLADYYREGRMRRSSCELRPKQRGWRLFG